MQPLLALSHRVPLKEMRLIIGHLECDLYPNCGMYPITVHTLKTTVRVRLKINPNLTSLLVGRPYHIIEEGIKYQEERGSAVSSEPS